MTPRQDDRLSRRHKTPWLAAKDFPAPILIIGTRGIHADGHAHGQDVFTHLRAANHNGSGPWSDPAVVLVS